MTESKTILDQARFSFPDIDPEILKLLVNLFPLDELFRAMNTAPYADSLHEPNRFKQRFYFPQYGDTDEVWRVWVEPFTSLIEHQRDFTVWSLAFHASEDHFSQEEQVLGILADAIHDLGEARVAGQEFIGDIMSGLKTMEDEDRESVVAHAAIEALGTTGMTDLFVGYLHEAYDQVVVGQNEKLYRAHKAREKWDYVRTALHLHQLASLDTDFFVQSRIYALDWFICRILAYDLPKVARELAYQYPNSIGKQLNQHESEIESAFIRSQLYLDQLQSGVITTKIQDNFNDLQQKLELAYQLWKEWKNGLQLSH